MNIAIRDLANLAAEVWQHRREKMMKPEAQDLAQDLQAIRRCQQIAGVKRIEMREAPQLEKKPEEPKRQSPRREQSQTNSWEMQIT